MGPIRRDHVSATVGIAIPAYGRGRHLGQTLESALAQTRSVKEIVVVDDCSPDETGEVARSFENRGVTFVRNPVNLGVPANYNSSLGRLSTDYVMILEDHDLLEPTFIEKCAALMDSHAEVTLVGTAIADIDEATSQMLRIFTSSFDLVQHGQRLAEFLLTHTHAPLGLTTLIRRSALRDLEPWFDPKYWWYADVHLWIRLALKGSFGYIREPLLKMRRREAGHFLHDRAWQSIVCCDRIRRDNWQEVFPRQDSIARLKWASYCAARDYEGMRILLSQMARDERGVPRDAMAMFSRPGRLAAALLMRLPSPFARLARIVHHAIPRV